jgi:hypothetical protein
MSPWLRQQLELRSRATGRSLGAELELLVEQRIREDKPVPAAWEAIHARPTQALMWLVSQVLVEAGWEWLQDPQAYDDVVTQVEHIFRLLDPRGTGSRGVAPGAPAYKLLARYFGPYPRPADAMQAQWLKASLGEAAQRLVPQEGVRHD